MEAATTITRPQPKLGTLVHFEIPASDPEKSSKFYQQLFQWKIAKVPMGPMDYWLISEKDAAENDTMGGLFKRMDPNQQILNYFLVKSIDESAGKAQSLGAKVLRAKEEIPDIGWFSILADPDGNTFALYQTKNRM